MGWLEWMFAVLAVIFGVLTYLIFGRENEGEFDDVKIGDTIYFAVNLMGYALLLAAYLLGRFWFRG